MNNHEHLRRRGHRWAAAKRFVEEGVSMFIIGRREPELSAAIQKIGRNVTGLQGDVSKLGDLDRLFDRIQRSPDVL